MTKKPHHSTVFRRKAIEQIHPLQRELHEHEVAHKLQRQINELEADKRTLCVKLSAMATKLASSEEARNSLLKSKEENQLTIDRLTATLREILLEAGGIVTPDLEDPASTALGAVREAGLSYDKLANDLAEVKCKLSEQESVAESFKREASVHRERAAFFESQLRQRDNTCGKLMAGLVALGVIAVGVVIYNL